MLRWRMCASTMQTQAAKNLLGSLGFPGNLRKAAPEEIVYPLQDISIGRLNPQSGLKESLDVQFGLVPSWVDEKRGGPKFGRYTYNARSETIFQKPSFRKAILSRRAIIPVQSFYEFPDKEEPLLHRLRIERKDGQPFWLAGIWESNRKYNLRSVSIVTLEPMDLVKPFHSRSPLILSQEQTDLWLGTTNAKNEISALFTNPPSDNFCVIQEDWKPKTKIKS